MFWYGKDSWFSVQQPNGHQRSKERDTTAPRSPVATAETDEETKLLTETLEEEMENEHKMVIDQTKPTRNCRYWCVTIVRTVAMSYVAIGLTIFAVGIFWRTRSYFALFGPIVCFLIVFTGNGYYILKRKGRLRRWEERGRRVEERLTNCGFGQNGPSPSEETGLDLQ